MRASSAAAREAGRKVLKEGTASAWQTIGEVSADLFAAADLVRANPSLARAMTDPARSGEDKAKLANDVFGSSLQPLALEVLTALTGGRWSQESDLALALEDIAVDGQLYSAASKNNLVRVGRDLFAVTQLLGERRDLRNALSDSAVQRAPQRARLAQSVFRDALCPQALQLVERATMYPRGGSLLSTLRRDLERASSLRERKLVTVEAPQELSESQLNRLRQILCKRYGKDVELNVSIVPSLLGGLRVHTSSHITDGTVRKALARTRERLAG